MNTACAILFAACLCALGGTEQPFAQNPALLVNPQGLAQRDYSIRGSGYAGVGVSINGLNLDNPWSRHFTADLPFPADWLSAPTIQTGLDNASGSLAGTVAHQTVPRQDAGEIRTGIGTKEHYSTGVSAFSSGVGGFLDGEKARRIDYGANDLDRYSGGAQLQHTTADWQIDALGAGQRKDFGAQGYYGIPASIRADERTDDALFLLGATHGDTGDAFLRASAAWRRFDDHYRIPSLTFASDVRSDFGAVAVEGRTMEIQGFALRLRGDVEHERIDGTFGEHDRTRGSALLLPQFTAETIVLKAGLDSVFQTDESADWLPQAGAEWHATDNDILYASYSENARQPDFQTLLGTDPYHVANPTLPEQRAQNVELGFRQFVSESLDWRAAIFRRRTEHAADWTKANATDTQWTATDLGALDAAGAESEVAVYPSKDLELRLFYQWVVKDDAPLYAGLYELDYPEHLLAFSGRWRIAPQIELAATQTLRRQAANNARAGGDFGADASAGLQYLPNFAKNTRLSLRVDNLWGSDFQAIPGLKPPGRTFSTGIAVAW